MSGAARQVVARVLAGRGAQARESATVYAPANIALVKYWGKRDEVLNLPVTGSLSISLGPLGSHVTLGRGAGAATRVATGSAWWVWRPFRALCPKIRPVAALRRPLVAAPTPDARPLRGLVAACRPA